MMASTIVEYYVEEDSVSVELEIGFRDLEAFRNLLPDAVYERLGHAPELLVERFPRFFQEDFVLRVAEGDPLPVRLVEMEPRQRIRRDEISGEPLPDSKDQEETVIFVRLWYPLQGKPKRLRIGGLATTVASLGFVLYHKSIAVNDFRYLGASQTLELDWEDPWYSQFDVRTLRRAYFAPMSGFLYVEPYEVRKEIILRAKDLQHWLDLDLADRETIPVEMQDRLKRQVAEFLRERQPVTIDGDSIAPDLAQINFLERTLRSSRVIDPPIELDLNGAILGAIFVYPTAGLPNTVTMEWDLFNERIQRIPAATVDQAGALPTYLEPDFKLLEWKNFLKNPKLPTLALVATPPGPAARVMALLRPWLLAATLLLTGLGLRRRGAPFAARFAPALIALLLAAVGFWGGRDAQPSTENTREIVSGLLHNIYLAFDYRNEEQIYDVLARSIQGDLLTQVYLETRRGLELANQGGARAKVKQVELGEVLAERSGPGFRALATWVVAGSVGHWGHVHQRSNRYHASLIVQPVDGAWKLADLEILEEMRL
jgi:hypothetical protein